MADYIPTNWQSGMPITSALMNHIENGIAAQASDIVLVNQNINNIEAANQTRDQNISNALGDAATAKTNAARALETANQSSQAAADATWARTRIEAAEIYDNNGAITSWADSGSISARLDNMTRVSENLETDKAEQSDLLATQAQADRNSNNIQLIQTQINNAAGSYMNDETGQQTQRTLKQKIDSLDYELSTHGQTMTDIQNDLDGIRGSYATPGERITDIVSDISDIQEELDDARVNGSTLDERFDAIDGGSTPSRTLPNLITEVNNSHMGTYDSLNARLNRIDGGAIKSTSTARDIVDLTSEVNDAHRTTDDTLSARFSAIDTSLSGLGTADTGLNNRIGALETEVGNAHRTGLVDDQDQPIIDTLANRFNDLEDELDTPTTGLKARMTTAEGDIDALENALNTAETGVLARLTSAEGRLNDIDTPETGALAVLDGRVEALETTVDTATTGLSDRMIAAEAAISHAAEGNDPGGLTERMTAAETSLAGKANSSDVTNALATKASTTDVNDLDTRLDKIDGGDTLTGDTLVSRVTALETAPKSATIVVEADCVSYDAQTGNPTIYTDSNKTTPVAPSTDVDYLLGKDDKYYYWKYIKTGSNPDTFAWALISGGGGEGNGNTSGYDMTRAAYNNLTAEDKKENTDFYVTEPNGLIRHYRYVMIGNALTEVEIGTLDMHIKKYNISSDVQTVRIDNEDTEVTYLHLHEFDYGEDSDEPTADSIITSIPLPVGSGGGASFSAQKMVRITERSITQPLGAATPVEFKFFYTSGVAKESGIARVLLDDTVVIDNIPIVSGDPAAASSDWPATTPIPNGFYSIDVSEYCTTLGIKHFKVVVADAEDASLTKELKWDVNVMNLTLTSNFTENSINTLGSNVRFTYIPNGDIDKVAHFKLGNTELATVNLSASTSGIEQEYVITTPAEAGAYRLEAWLTASANGHALPPSQSIYRDIIWYDTSSSDVIISSKYRDNVAEPLTQYDSIEIPYTIVGGTIPYTVYYYVDDMSAPINEVTLTGNSGVWEYRADIKGSHTLQIACQEATMSFTINVSELNIDIAPVTVGLVLDFNPQGITNTSSKRLWTNGTYSMTVSDNFDWYNGGYGSDDDGDYFLIKAGTRAQFDYKMFTSTDTNGSLSNKIFEDGAEFKIIFKTMAVRNADAVWFSNMGPSSSSANAKQVGIQLGAHNGFLKTDSASNVEVGGVAATNTYLYFPYSEEDKIELDININQTSENNNFIMSYEDGCPSKAYPYKTSEVLYHAEGQEADITIGSDDCDVYIYRIRIYDTELSTEQVLRNFIADGKTSAESITRYNRNCIYYDTKKEQFVPYAGQNTVLDPERLATKIPDVKVLMLETPRFTMNKKDFVPYSSLRCIHAPGGKYFKSRGKLDNWKFINGYHAGQGTTSDKYGNAGRNLDFLFMCDGIHNPSDKVKPDKGFIPGYQSALILGYGTDEQEDPTYCLDWKDEDTWAENKAYTLTDNGHDTLVRYNGEVYKCIEAHTSTSEFDSTKWELQEGYTSKITLKSTSIPNNFFNLKVNIASSENANNALLQKRYNDFLLYSSPAHERDNRIKNDMEFVPAIIFVRETGIMDPDGAATAAERQEFNDDQWHFYALGNIGDSKKTDYTRAYDPEDMNEFTLEISDNNTNNSQFQSGVYLSSVYYHRVATPVINDIDKYYEVDGTATAVQDKDNWYTGTFNKTTDTEIDNNKIYYTPVRRVEPYSLEQDMDDGKIVEGSFTARSDAEQSIQTTEYLFPITIEEWTGVDSNDNPLNMRYWSLFNEGFDGDHSFEMRYACKGDYRDGKVVNDTTGQAKAQLKLNEKVWRAFYTWLVTSDNATFVNELDQWVVRSSVEYYYAFTHYYTMMDNRAKNTFWHFAKTGKHRKVTHPVAALLHIYEEADGNVTASAGDSNVWEGTFIKTQDSEIDPNKQYYTQYAFDMWVYDTDTALGIDNNGELVFPYGKEDTDYRIEGDASSSMVFNGAGSIFWCRLRDNCIEDIRSIFTSVSTECFNANTLINEFDQWQECYPEAIWRLDVERKYIRSFTGDTGPNGVYLTRKETRFLRDMMQGRKKYQRRQWVKDQDIYFGSKYMLPSVSQDFFEFSCYQPKEQVVTPNWDLTITPYQDMYINISYAETFANPFRAKAGVTYEFKSIFDQMNDSRIRVFGANHIQGLAGKAKREDPNDPDKITGAEGLASFYIKANNFEHGKKLRSLILGTDNTSYQNGNFTTLNIANDYPILEVFNIKNCGNLGGSLDFSKSTALQVIEAQGTQITQVMLPSSTGIKTLHLPETITKISLQSAKQLEEITLKERNGTVNMSNLTSLEVNDSDYNVDINWMDLAKATLNHLDTLSLLNLRTSYIGNIDELETFKLRKNIINRVYLSGVLGITGTWSEIQRDTYGGLATSVWPSLTFDTTNGTKENKTKVVYMESGYYNDEGWVDEREIDTRYITANQVIPDIYAGTAAAGLPSRASTIGYTYQFGTLDQGTYVPYSGWTLTRNNYNAPDEPDLSLYAAGYTNNRPPTAVASQDTLTYYSYYHKQEHQYTVKWYLHPNQLIKSVANQGYGGGYNLIAPTVKEIRENYSTSSLTFNSNRTVTIEIFDGWEKLPTNIDPSSAEAETDTYNINAVWYTRTYSLDTMFSDTTIPMLDKLFVLSRMTASDKAEYPDSANIAKTMKYEYMMGYDGFKIGTPIVNTSNILRQTANSSVSTYNNVQPFLTNDGFTLVLDYQFDNTQIVESFGAVLVGCYSKNNGNITGFALFNNNNAQYGDLGINIGCGNMFNNNATENRRIGNTGERNILVIRKPKNSTQLWFYSSKGANSTSADNIYSNYLNLGTFVSSDAVLCIGHLRADLNSSTIYSDEDQNLQGAIGTIYWAKYWNEDLGAGECRQLASWPRERMTAIIASIDENSSTNAELTRPSIYLTNLTSTNHGTITSSRFATNGDNEQGWANSPSKTACDNRIFSGLPLRLQSVLSHPTLGYRNFVYSYDNVMSSYNASLGNIQQTTGYVYVPSISSFIASDSNAISINNYLGESRLERTGRAQNSESDITPYDWIQDDSSIVVYQYNIDSETRWSAGSFSANYYNIRFANKSINWSNSTPMRIFYIPAGTVLNTSLASLIGGLQANDIVVRQGDAAYIYITGTEYNTYGYFTQPQSTSNSLFNTGGSGGWLRSNIYFTRSVAVGNQSNFIYIDGCGTPIAPVEITYQPGETLSIDFAFAI